MAKLAAGARLRPLPKPFERLPAVASMQTDRCGLWIFQPVPGILYTQTRGHLTPDIVPLFIEVADLQIARDQKVTHFHDLESTEAYESPVRTELTRWVLNRKNELEVVHLFILSRLVAMGIATANIATSMVGVHMHSSAQREPFEKVFAETVSQKLTATWAERAQEPER
jgi:hypothetical protein